MKELMQAIQNRDGAALSRFAGQGKQPQREEQAALVFNDLFRQLRATFPAITAHIKTQDDLNEFRRTWMMAFAENDITTIAQVNAGMQLARQQETPWVPSPGQFVAWCREGHLRIAGLPKDEELVEMVHDYCQQRGFLTSPESYPWKHPAHYWMVTALYSGMRAHNWTDKELLKAAQNELIGMEKKIRRGERIPAPVLVLTEKPRPPMKSEDALQRIAETRKRLGLPRRVK
ncbi:replication protein P [Klebsiella pasteurii]|uniref:replication protein P n=1 Tax=Klebsiella pasteurii TaxID=2587529 RepID=UPI0035D02BB7